MRGRSGEATPHPRGAREVAGVATNIQRPSKTSSLVSVNQILLKHSNVTKRHALSSAARRARSSVFMTAQPLSLSPPLRHFCYWTTAAGDTGAEATAL